MEESSKHSASVLLANTSYKMSPLLEKEISKAKCCTIDVSQSSDLSFELLFVESLYILKI